jgi:serine/threonine-protein kinase
VKPKSTFSQRLRDWLRLDSGPSLETSTEILELDNQQLSSITLPESLQDRYRPLRVLGRGAFGVVLLARDLLIGRLISIKLLFQHRRHDQEVYQQFLQEARIAGQIEHPNIVTIYDVHDDRRNACILMEYLAGGNLQRRLELDGPLTEERALDHMLDIVDGLRAAHQMGVIHRDIKPQNILFDQNGRPVITDFGVAQLPLDVNSALEEDSDDALRIVGTPEYMAPEQMVLGSPVDGRADLYAAGLLCYEMLTGKRLFTFTRQLTIEQLAEQAHKLDVAALAEFPAHVSRPTQEAVLKMTARQPAQRYPDAGAALLALQTAQLSLQSASGAEQPGLTTEISLNRQEMYQDILRLFLVDGVVSPPERRELDKRAERLGVKPEMARHLEEEIRQELGLPLQQHLVDYEARVERALSDGALTPADEASLARLAEQYNIPNHEQRKVLDRVMIKLHMKEE